MTAPGLQGERTSLAWNRTALALLGESALLLVRDRDGAAGPVLAAGALLLALAAALVARSRDRAVATGHRPSAGARRAQVVGLGLAVAVLALAVGATTVVR